MSFNWLPLPSIYNQARNWTIRQQILRQQVEDLAAISDEFASAKSDQADGVMKLAANAALDRTQAAAKAKVNSVLAGANSPSSSSSSDVTLPDGSTLKVDPTQYLPGGSKLNLTTGTLTLPNGTVIDTATGAKKVDLTV